MNSGIDSDTQTPGTVVQDTSGAILYANDAAEHILGLTIDQMRGRTLMDPRWRTLHEDGSVFPGDEHPSMIALATGETQRGVRMNVALPNDERRWLEVDSVPLRNDDGIVAQVVTTFADISASRTEHARLRSIYDAMTCGVFVVDKQGFVREANAEAQRLLGLSREALIGHTLGSVTGMSLREDGSQLPIGKRPIGCAFTTGEAVRDVIFGLERLDGTLVWLRTDAAPQKDANNRVTHVVSSFVDVTERKRAEGELRASKERYRLVEQYAPIGLALVSLKGRWLRVNPKLCTLTGYDEVDLLTMSMQDFNLLDEQGEDRMNAQRLLAGEIETYRVEKCLCRRNGSKIWINMSASLARDDKDAPIYFIAQFEDIDDRRHSASIIQKSEARFRALTEHSQDLVSILTQEGDVLYESPSYERVLGQSLQSVFQTHGSTLAIVHPDDREAASAVFLRICSAGHAIETMQWRLHASDGSWRVFECIAANHLNDPAIKGIVITNRDVTSRVEAEMTVHESERRLRLVVESAPIILSAIDREGLITLSVGSGLAAIGSRPNQSIGNSIFDYYAPDTVPGSCFVRALAGETVVETIDVRGVKFDSHYTPFVDDNGHIVGAIAVSTDITARAQAEEAQKHSESQLRALISNAPVILFSFDPDGIYTASEGAALKAIGRLPGASVGLSVFEAYSEYPDIIASTRQALLGVTTTVATHIGDAYFENYLVPVRDDGGKVVQVIGVSVDVTDRARAENALRESKRDLERSNAELKQFAYAASHDLQEPLRTITSYLQLLDRRYNGKVLDEDAKEYIDFAVGGAKRMQALIHAVLDLSLVGTKGGALVPIDTFDVAHKAIASLMFRIADTDADVHLSALPIILGDAAQLTQLFQNLIGNALKYCRQQPIVQLSAELIGDEWVFNIHDNGIGIAPEDGERIFDAFKRLHGRDEFEGTGIGLATCRKIVERHNGRMWVESEVGNGASFMVAFPALSTE